jgi:integrase
MAWHELDKASGYYRIGFRFGGKKYLRSKTLKIRDIRQAESKCGVIEQTIRYLDDGVLTLPEGIDPGEFILSGGKLTARPVAVAPPKELTLKTMFDGYDTSIHSKEESTRRTERTHVKHLLRILRPQTIVDRIEKKDVQAYVEKRAGETYKRTGRKTTKQTIQKELGTLSVVWKWAKDAGEVKTGPPTRDLRFPKGVKKDPFRTWLECEREIEAAGLAGRADEDLTKLERGKLREIWEALFLAEDEILTLLEHVRDKKAFPMFAFAAYTGARRSEMCRSETSDVNFDRDRIKIREMKRDTSVNITYRFVPLHHDLREILSAWLSDHPGGKFLFPGQGDRQLTQVMATKRFRSAVKSSRWKDLRGWHTFRHSFASNLARNGVPQAHIDEMMGHETEVMRERYRHLFPHDLEQSVGRLFSRRK